MITEDYVSFEAAKLLKEKGFDEECWTAYTGNNWTYEPPFKNSEFNLDAEKSFFTIPPLQMAMKWLREEHSIHIKIDCIGAKNYIPTIQFIYSGKDIVVESNTSKIGGNGFDSNEEACEAAIKYCLENLI